MGLQLASCGNESNGHKDYTFYDYETHEQVTFDARPAGSYSYGIYRDDEYIGTAHATRSTPIGELPMYRVVYDHEFIARNVSLIDTVRLLAEKHYNLDLYPNNHEETLT